MADDKDMKQVADRLFQLLSGSELNDIDKASAAAIIKETPEVLTCSSFMANIAPASMSECPETGYTDYISDAATKQNSTINVLDNLKEMYSENIIGRLKNGKTPAQQVLDEGYLPNGETIGTQTIKNITLLRAMRSDEKYPNKDGVEALHQQSEFLLHNLYAREGYDANPNRRNVQGQKAGDIIKIYLNTISPTRNMETDHLKNQASQRQASASVIEATNKYHQEVAQKRADRAKANAAEEPNKTQQPQAAAPAPAQPASNVQAPTKGSKTIEDIARDIYQGKAVSVEDRERYEKEQAKKEGNVTERSGDVQTPTTERDKEKFTKGDVVEYMYTEWFLGLLSAGFNKVEDYTLGLVDGAAGVFIESCKRRRERNNEIKDDNVRFDTGQVNNFGKIYEAVLSGRTSAYAQNKAEYEDMFKDLACYLEAPDSYELKYKDQYSPEFLEKLKNDEKAKDFIVAGKEAIFNNIDLMQSADKLALALTQIEMTHEYMCNQDEWMQARGLKDAAKDFVTRKNSKQPKTNDEMKKELEDRAHKRQIEILKALAVIQQDARVVAEIAYDDMDKDTREKLIAEMVAAETSSYLQALATQIKQLGEKQNQEIDNGRFASAKNPPDKAIYIGIKAIDESIGKVVLNGNMYDQKIFADTRAKEIISTQCTLFEEASKQNQPSIWEQCQELTKLQADALESRKENNKARTEKLNKFKVQMNWRDGKNTVDKRLEQYKQQASARS